MSFLNLSDWVTQTWWPFVGSASLASSLVFLLSVGVWYAVRRRASSHFGYALFLLPLVPFIVPLQGLAPLVIPANSALSSFLPQEQHPVLPGPALGLTSPGTAAATHGEGFMTSGIAPESPSDMLDAADQAGERKASSALSLPLLVFSVWLFVGLWLAARWALALYHTALVILRAAPLRDSRSKLLVRRALAGGKVPSNTRVVESREVHAPAVFGLLRPVLLVPEGFAKDIDDETFLWSLEHELAHLRRRDLLLSSLQQALAIVWWFHPGLWLLNRTLNELRECACDEAAMARMPDYSGQRAANGLIDIIESTRPPASPRLAVESLFSERTCLEKRIMRLIEPHRVRRAGLTPVSLLFLSLTAGVGFASTQLVAKTDAGKPAVAQSSTEVEGMHEVALEDEVIEEGDSPAGEAITRSLDWITTQQHADGHWDTGSSSSEVAGEFNAVGVTALAIECLVASNSPAYKKPAERGLAWLASVQDEELGLFGRREGISFVTSHAVATRVWIQSHGENAGAEVERVSKLALQFCYASQNPYAGWRFAYPPNGDNDSFVTSLMLRALSAARDAGLEVEADSLQSGRELLKQLVQEETGRVGYVQKGGPAGRLAKKAMSHPPQFSEYPTAVSLLAWQDLDLAGQDSPWVEKGLGLLAQSPPKWDTQAGTNDGYYWMYGTESMRKLGGRPWQHWQIDILDALLPSQSANGSWPLADAWSAEDDFVHMTCVYTRALQETLK
ncbi:MAG: beta-lactamase regulating signal transducer with metallopeptidase domain [Candidatus Paceibacteria bacterium]|jgi:beta-lactamase regulating signal transducer with metallopeptidase domain